MKKLLMLTGALVTAFCTMADTWTDPETGIKWTYYLNGQGQAILGTGEAAITSSTSGDIVIPPTFGGCPVVIISNYAFWTCSKITGVTIPTTVTSIGDNAFAYCSALRQMVIPGNVKSIGEGTFGSCPNMTNVVLSTGIVTIKRYAFSNCTGLTSVTIPSTVTSFGECIFNSCFNLNTIDFEGAPPSGVGNASIKQNAAIRYNIAYKTEWEAIITTCGWTNAKPYNPFPPTITDVTAQQRYPWNGMVDISYSAMNIEETAKKEGLMVSLKVAAIDQDAGTTNVATTLSGDMSLADGTHKIVWDMNAQGLDIKSTNVVFTVACESEKAKYCIVDLSAGSTATSYPVSYTNEIPGGSWSDEYKTTKLVLQRIEPGTCVVRVDKPYYVGVFEMTQKQWELVMGSNPSYWTGPMRPVERVTYNMIRGSNKGSQYPSSTDVDEDSFMGKLRVRTGLHIDLPSEAQWEYACRAGTTTVYSYGDNANGDYMWYSPNSGSCTHDVGTRNPNPWGLYDVHGNAWEWCLDWYPSWSGRIVRGGSWNDSANDCRSAYRDYGNPSYGNNSNGFRLALSLPIAVVNFDANGGQCGEATRDCRIGDPIGKLPEATSEAGKFLGWYTEVSGGTLITENTVVENSMTLYAHWDWDPYMIIDLSGGSAAMSYPVSYTNEIPGGSWSDEYKTTKLVLQCIDPGTCVVAVDKSYYIGVFEMTQKQWELVMGTNPSKFLGDKRPVEQVTYSMIRGLNKGAQYPDTTDVDADSYMGKMRARTGMLFDLPTETQWEYACRSGTTTTYSYGNSANGDYMWYCDNSDSITHDVGMKYQNPWGLYDVHGNVLEWCLDWFSGYPGSGRVLRSGSMTSSSDACTSASRIANTPSEVYPGRGFRLVRNLSASGSSGNHTQLRSVCGGSSKPVRIDLTIGTRIAEKTEVLTYSTNWVENAGADAVAEVAVEGVVISSESGSGTVEWTPKTNGTYHLTHTIKTTGEVVGEVLTATFLVEGLRPEPPVINPVSGTTFDSSLTVSMTCASEGATIHYTTDGTTPTMESTTYKKFKIYGKTTVKAIAFWEDGTPSEMAVAEYAKGVREEPTVTPPDGTVFEHSGQVVSVAHDNPEGVLRYTIDGSDPTAESPEYTEPFTIDETTVVKAKVFGDQYFDSSITTATLTRVWVKVATPEIKAQAQFTGSKQRVDIVCATEGATVRYTTDGTDPNSHSPKYTKPFYVTDTTTVKAYATKADYVNSDIGTFLITKVWGIGDTMGKPDHAFETSGAKGFVRVEDKTATLGESMKSGAIADSEKSILSTTVIGPGTLTFKWKASCEEDDDYEWDHGEFKVNGEPKGWINGITDWIEVSQRIVGKGTNTVTWTYVKDENESEKQDCIWVSDYAWASDYTETQTTEVPVPYDWLKEKSRDIVDEYDNYEKVAKQTAYNPRFTVEQCYVAGLNPESTTNEFTSAITMEGGIPKITWAPDLGEEREYKVWGKESLIGGDWVCPTNSLHRFFKVTVEMP